MKCDHKIKEMHIEQLNYTRNASLYYEAVGLVELNSFCLLCFFFFCIVVARLFCITLGYNFVIHRNELYNHSAVMAFR